MIQSVVTALVLILVLALIALFFVCLTGELPDDLWVRAINYLYFHMVYILLIAITIHSLKYVMVNLIVIMCFQCEVPPCEIVDLEDPREDLTFCASSSRRKLSGLQRKLG